MKRRRMRERRRAKGQKRDTKRMMRNRRQRQNNSGEHGEKRDKKNGKGKKGKDMKEKQNSFLLIPWVQKRLSEMTDHAGSNGNAPHFYIWEVDGSRDTGVSRQTLLFLPQPLHENSRIVSYISPRSIPSESFPIYHSSSDHSSLNKQQITKIKVSHVTIFKREHFD